MADDQRPPIGSDARLASLTERLRALAARLNHDASYLVPMTRAMTAWEDAAAVHQAVDLLAEMRESPQLRLLMQAVDPITGAVTSSRMYAFDVRGELQPVDGPTVPLPSSSLAERVKAAGSDDSDAQMRNRMLTVPVSDDPRARSLHTRAQAILEKAIADATAREDPPTAPNTSEDARAVFATTRGDNLDHLAGGALPAGPPAPPMHTPALFAGESCAKEGCTAPVTSRVMALHYCTEHAPPPFPPSPRRA